MVETMVATLTPPGTAENSPKPSPWTGKADLVFEWDGTQTRRIKTYTQAPLRLQRSHYPEGPGRCYTTIVHTAGGMVGGDQLHQRIELGPQSQVLCTTPAATKIYQSTGDTSIQSTQIQVAAGASLEWFPQESIVFNGADYHQTVKVELEPGAWILLWDITRFGRSAMGERFESGRWRADLEFWQAGLPLWIDRQGFQGDPAALANPHGLNGFPVVGTFALVGRDIEDATLDHLRHQLTMVPADHVGLTRNLKGFVCRYRGPSSQIARRCFHTLWRQLRGTWYGKMPPVPRVWN